VEKPRSGTASCRLDRRLRSRQSSLHISSSSPVARSTTSVGDGGASACLSGRRGLRSLGGRSVDSVRLTAAVETWSVGHRASKVLLRGSPFTTGEGRSLGWSVCHFDGSPFPCVSPAASVVCSPLSQNPAVRPGSVGPRRRGVGVGEASESPCYPSRGGGPRSSGAKFSRMHSTLSSGTEMPGHPPSAGGVCSVGCLARPVGSAGFVRAGSTVGPIVVGPVLGPILGSIIGPMVISACRV
jgi:hypothetical protein